MAETLSLSQDLYQEIIQHLAAEKPLEGCGILSGQDGQPVRFFPARNEARSETFYNIAPEDLFRIMRQIDRSGETLWGIVHSHPATPAYPSSTDIRLAFYPDVYYLIVSLADPERPDLRAFTIRDGQVTEHPIHVGR